MRDLQTAAGKRSPADFAASYLAKFGGSPITGADASVLLGKGLYGTVTFTFSDLDPLDTFSLYVYVGNKAEVATTISITSPDGGSQMASLVRNQATFAVAENYVVFTGLVPNASGQITGSVGGDWSALNGLQLQTTAVPEPGSMALIGVGLAILGARRPFNRKPSV